MNEGTASDVPQEGPSLGESTGVGGTPMAVDFSRDRRARFAWLVLLAGPVLWFSHFMFVYLVVEAGCAPAEGLAIFNPPVPTVVTLIATAVAAVVALGLSRWTYRLWKARPGQPQSEDPQTDHSSTERYVTDQAIAFGGLLLCCLSFITILFVGVPAAVLTAC